MNDVTITANEILNFFNTLNDEEINLFFTILATGKTAEYARNYINCVRSENSTERSNHARRSVEEFLNDYDIDRRFCR